MVASRLQDRSEPARAAAGGPPFLSACVAAASEKLIAALCSDQDVVVVSSAPGCMGSAAARLLAACLPRLQATGFATASITAPLSLSVLHDAIRETLTGAAMPGRPLLVVIEHAENLLLPTVRRLAELAALRCADRPVPSPVPRPVIRLLLVGTPALWPALRAAGLAELEHDATAHIRLEPHPVAAIMPRIRVPQPPAWASRGSERNRMRAGRGVVGLTLLALAATAAAFCFMPGPMPDAVRQEPPPVSEDRLAMLLQRQATELAAGKPDRLIETRRQIETLIPSLSSRALERLGAPDDALRAATRPPLPRSPPPGPTPPGPTLPDDPVHVTVRYARDDADAAARATRIVAQLRQQGMLADGLAAREPALRRTSIAYYFAQDRSAADRLARRLLPEAGPPRMPAPDTEAARPGEIIVSIGSEGKRT